jgi:hypothetical protein
MGFLDKLPMLQDGALPFYESPPLCPAADPATIIDLKMPDHDLARAMAEAVLAFSPASDTDALKLLRAAFPNSPLGLRVAALALLTRRRGRGKA